MGSLEERAHRAARQAAEYTRPSRGTSVRQTDSVYIANVDASFRRSVVPLIGFATSQRELGAVTLRSTRSSLTLVG